MTYNQVVTTIRSLLESHQMIQQAKFATPREWLFRDEQPTFPVCCFAINTGSLNVGREQIYNISLWFLDKAGIEAKYETEVISDQLQIAADIVSKLRSDERFIIEDAITYECLLDKFEDYLAGVTLTINLNTISNYDACDAPFT